MEKKASHSPIDLWPYVFQSTEFIDFCKLILPAIRSTMTVLPYPLHTQHSFSVMSHELLPEFEIVYRIENRKSENFFFHLEHPIATTSDRSLCVCVCAYT